MNLGRLIIINTFSHIIIGNLLYEYVKKEYGICLEKRSFIRGNYSPDFSIKLITSKHHIEEKLEFVENEFTKLAAVSLESADISKDYSKRMGIICHYLTDFFCYAHSEHFSGNTADHVLYERTLHKFISEKLEILMNLKLMCNSEICWSSVALSTKVRKYHNDYINSSSTLGNDAVFSLLVCIETIVSIVMCSNKQNVNEAEGFHTLNVYAC